MLIIPRSDTNPIAVLDFNSLKDCEATADHVAQIRTSNTSTVGLPGAWEANFKYGGRFRLWADVSHAFLPSVDEIPAVAEGLKAEEFYKDLYE